MMVFPLKIGSSVTNFFAPSFSYVQTSVKIISHKPFQILISSTFSLLVILLYESNIIFSFFFQIFISDGGARPTKNLLIYDVFLTLLQEFP